MGTGNGNHASVFLRILACALVLVSAPGARAKDKKPDSYQISGFIGLNETQPASKVVVKLLEGESGKVVGMVETGFFGKYKFEKLKPGLYVIQVREFKHEILLKEKDRRIDFDLSSKDGLRRGFTMEKLAGALGGTGGGSAVAAGPATGPNDTSLMQTMAGQYWGYSGSTEMTLVLCANGTFAEQSEFSASGSGRDSLGNQTHAWGTASQGGARGNWNIQGDQQRGTIVLVYSGGRKASVPYRVVDSQCWSFDGRTLCRKGPAACQ